MQSKRSTQNDALIAALRLGEDFTLEEDDEEDTGRKESKESNEKYEEEDDDDSDECITSIPSTENMKERAKFIPLRLSYEQRKSLRLVNAAISVSDYTNAVDRDDKASKRLHKQLQQICGFLSGVIGASDYDAGQEVLESRNFGKYEQFLQDTLEICRRYKVMNPEKMRSEYGKLVLLMQDAISSDIQSLIGANIHKPIETVYSLLEKKGGLELLEDSNLTTATSEILPDERKTRDMLDTESKLKQRSIKIIVRKYRSHILSAEDIETCLYSICDNNSFLNANLRPINKCIDLLQNWFHPRYFQKGSSLGIEEGEDGSRLSHSHEEQFRYVLQSLSLWSSIIKDIFRLWYLSEADLLDSTLPYSLKDTGQGLQRVQESPRVYGAMHELLQSTKLKLGGWVGSSTIHLGDHNVPNALIFIDKYTQVSRILTPLICTLSNLDKCCNENEGLRRYISSYGGVEKAQKDILLDFFRHGFDGSGGNNDFDAGSCIDGRLTSAWNWCSQLPSKPFYILFKLTGFLSFDGEFES